MKADVTVASTMLHLALRGVPVDARAGLLTLRAGERHLRIGLPRAAGLGGQLCARMPVNALGDADFWDWPALELSADFGKGPEPVEAACYPARGAGEQSGHVSGLDESGCLTGWSTAAGVSLGTELPLHVRIGDQVVPGMTQGGWRRTAHRAYALPLVPFLPDAGLVKVEVTGGFVQSRPFSRGQFFAGLTSRGVLQAAPVTVIEGVAAGAFQIAGLEGGPLRLSLRQGDRVTEPCNCNRASAPNHDFNGRQSGFFIRLPAGFDPETTHVVLGHPRLPRSLEYPLRDLLVRDLQISHNARAGI